MDKKKLYEEIHQYLSGTMTDQEKGNFEARIKSDRKLFKEVDYFRKAHRLMAAYQEDLLRKSVADQVTSQLKIPVPIMSRRGPKVWTAAAASFLLLFGISEFHAYNNYSDGVLARRGTFEPESGELAGNSDRQDEFEYP